MASKTRVADDSQHAEIDAVKRFLFEDASDDGIIHQAFALLDTVEPTDENVDKVRKFVRAWAVGIKARADGA